MRLARTLLNVREPILLPMVFGMAESSSDSASSSQGGGSRLIATFVVALLAAALAGGGVYWLTTKSADATAMPVGRGKALQGPPIYLEFDPPFVVNFEAKGTMRFLQVTIKAMTRDPYTAQLIEQHDPVIRNDLLMLLSSQTYETLSSREGKEKLRAEALQVVANVVDAEGGNGANVEQLFFTSFVMQ